MLAQAGVFWGPRGCRRTGPGICLRCGRRFRRHAPFTQAHDQQPSQYKSQSVDLIEYRAPCC